MSSKSDRGTKRPKNPKERQPVGDLINHPCGCVEQKYDDGSIGMIECPPHGLMTAARALGDAAQALGTVGQVLFNDGVKGRAADANEAGNKLADELP